MFIRQFLFLKKVFFFLMSFRSQSRIFHLFGDVTFAGEGLQISTYARHVLSLSREGFKCATPTVTGDIRLL